MLSSSGLAQDSPYSEKNQLNINNATLLEIKKLPISEELANAIYYRITYRGVLKSVYDLRPLNGMTQEIFNTIKPMLRVEPFEDISGAQQRIEQVYYRLDRWSGNEGTNDAFIDLWIERVLDPLNVNTARYDDLINLQNISPIDAVSIIKYRESTGGIKSMRDLRGVPGLSYYGYSNARNFVDYDDSGLSGAKKLHGHFTLRMDNTPFFGDEEEAAGNLTVDGLNSHPNQFVKGSISYGRDYKFGLSFTRYLGEPVSYSLNEDGFKLPNLKWYAGVENIDLSYLLKDLAIRKLYVGNYKVTFGQGIVMENTDFFQPRKDGFGFRKRYKGISGDNSKTRQFALRGLATELAWNKLSAIGFVSFNDRDAILNKQISDSTLGRSFNQLIILDQRFKYAYGDASRGPDELGLSWLDAVKELTLGGHLQYDFKPGTWLGVSFYESAYDRYLDPSPTQITADGEWSRRQVTADSEIKQAYGGPISLGSNPFWDDAVSFRRVYGFDFQTTFENLALMGEYAELDKGGAVFKLGDDPKAMVMQAYLQYPTFNIMALYRNYDVGFDNPYQRSFSNYRRFKGTIFEDHYYLQSPLYSQLYYNAAQPQAEEGFFISSYYQISRQLTSRVAYDNWVRKADQAKQFRLVGTLDYRPIFPLQFQFRQKWQAREKDNHPSLRYFESLEFRARVRARLSDFDNLTLIYTNGRTLVHPRPRIFGDITLDGEAFGSMYAHNFNKKFKLSGMLLYYKGFFWNFEDTQFVVMDSQRGAFRYFLSLYMRLNSNLAMRVKYTGDFQKRIENITFDDTYVQRQNKRNSFMYFEMNYNF